MFSNVASGLGADGKADKKERDIEAEKAAVDTTKEKYDVYADIDTKIKEINEKLKDQKRLTEHAATEEEKLESLAKEADILKDLNDAYAEKETIAKDTLSTIKTDLQNAANVDGLAVEINFDGDALRN
jgi:glycine cleavage system H lipoate-binding protein